MAGGSEVFVGRREELAALAAELDLGAEGPRLVWVEGEAGVGKTSLVRAAVARAGEGRRAVWAAGAEEEQGLPFGVTDRLARGLAAGLGPAVRPWRVTKADADPLAAGADLLAAIAESPVPAVLVLEDLQWADEESARALLFAARRLESEPVVVMVTSQPGTLAGLGGWARLLGDAARVRRVELGGLDAAELAELAAAVGAGRLDFQTARRLRDHTGGHPLHARALLAEVGVAGLAGRAGVLPAPRALATLIVARLGSLPPEARALVAAAAVLGPASRVADLATVSALDDPLPACDAAIGADLLEWPQPQTVSFPHPLIRAAVYNDLGLAARRALHLAAAGVTAGAAALEHRAAAAFGPDAGLAAELDALAASESGQDRAVLAARHWRQAAALSPTPADQDRRVLLAAERVFAAGLLAQARVLRPEVDRCADSAYRDYVLGCLSFTEGRLPEAEKLGTGALARAPADLAARIAAVTGFARMLLGAWPESLSVCRVALDGDSGWAAGLSRYALAVCDMQLGRLDDLELLDRRLRADAASGVVPRSDALTVSGVIGLWTDDLDRAAADLGEVVERSRAGQRTRLLTSALAALSEVSFRLGQWDDAVVTAELGVSLARDGEEIIGLQQVHSSAGIIHARCGRFDLAQSHVDTLTEVESLLPWWGATPLLAVSRAVLADARGDPDAMQTAVAPLLDLIADDPRHQLPRWPWRVLVIDALLGAGRTAAAESQLDKLDGLVRARRIAAGAAEVARLRGRLAQARGDLTQAGACYRAGLNTPGANPYDRARTQFALGRLHRLVGRPGQAARDLLAARAQFAALGAAPDLRLCDLELAACGQPAGQTAAPGQPSLTAAELSVANLAAQRLTNREVAARLYLSAKTVEYHLSHIYAKLGITSRRQLADRLGRR